MSQAPTAIDARRATRAEEPQSPTGQRLPQVDLDIAQGLPVGQLRKGHGEELIQAGEVLDLVLATMLGHAAPKGAHGQVGHELRKHELALVHADPSRRCAKGHKSDARRSNRDQTGVQNSASKSLTYEALMCKRWDTTVLW